MKTLIALALVMLGLPAQATVICAGCEYQETAAATFLGAFNAVTADKATFQNSDVGNSRFEDFWVFDLAPDALGSMSADFTLLASIGGFAAQLFADDGSQCAGSVCGFVSTGALIASAAGDPSRWEIVDFLPAGRYVLRIDGIPNPLNNGAYTGQMSFLALSIREAGTLGLFGLGLFAIGAACRKHQR